jgi:hypothetical protein
LFVTLISQRKYQIIYIIENEFIELITVIVDVLSEAPMASAFLCHIIGKKLKAIFYRDLN